MSQEIRARITSKLDFVLKTRDESGDLSGPFYAINWFNTAKPGLYKLYNFLVFPALRSVGGVAIFRGFVSETISGNPEDFRDQLLIVRYPGGAAFRQLVEKTWFKLVSVFRTKSTRDFTFGYSKMLDHTKAGEDRLGKAYAVLHFRGMGAAAGAKEIIRAAENTSVQITYAGELFAHLYAHPQGKDLRQVPNLMDGIVVFEAKEEAELRAFLEAEITPGLPTRFASSFVGLLRRTL